jgi:DNA primase
VGQLSAQSDVAAVRQATNLVALIGESVALRPRGREHLGLCPFHDDSHPSFAVVTHKGNAFYKCHACGAAGDCFTWMQEYHRMSFGEALRALADRAGITLHRVSQAGAASPESGRPGLRDTNVFAASFFASVMKNPASGQQAREMLMRRGVSEQMISQFQIGAAPAAWDGLAKAVESRRLPAASFLAAGLLKTRSDGSAYDVFRNRLILPICDELGRPIAFGGRQIDENDQPKYLNSPESALFKKSATLYGLHLAKREIIRARQAVIVEGYMDVIACHQAGIANVVGTLGTALTPDHARMLRTLCETIVLVFDGDEAGQRAADRAIEVLFHEPTDVRICVLPGELDPDDLLRQPDGPSLWHDAIAASQDALSFKVSRFRRTLVGAESPAVQSTRIEKFLAELAGLGFASMQGVRRAKYVTMLAGLLGVRDADVEASIPRSMPRRPVLPGGRAATPATREPLGASAGSSTGASPARRRAEHELLAVLIAQPTLGRQPVPGEAGKSSPVAAMYQPHEFTDETMRQIAELVFPMLADDVDFAVQDLLGRLTDPAHRNLVTTLYLDGARQCGDTVEAAVAALREAHTAMQQLMSRDHHARRVSTHAAALQTNPSSPVAAIELIEQRRQQGYNPVALPRGVRS